VNNRLEQLTESVTLRIADRVRALGLEGKCVIRLQTGDPDFPTHPLIIESAYRAMRTGETHYCNTRGLPELRDAIAAQIELRYGLNFDPGNEVLVTHGGIHAVMAAVFALVDAGDEVLIEDPCWMPYVGCTVMAGGTPVRFAADVNDGFRFSITNLQQKLTQRSRLLILNSPCNPTGRMLDRKTLQEIAALVLAYDLWIISDEVYEALSYGHPHVPTAALETLRSRTITIGSLSKTYAMTGWRVGYAVGPAKAISEMLKVSQYSITNVAPYVQRAAVTAITSPDVAQYVKDMQAIYAIRRSQVIETMKSLSNLKAQAPDGAFYFMIDISQSGMNSEAFASRLLEEYAVAVVPGQGFGPAADSFVRVTFAAPIQEVIEGLSLVGAFITKLLNSPSDAV